jgi:uncharacterized protein (TIGR03089 family)
MTMPRTTPEQLFADLLAAEPGRPFITYYDEATGERSELSTKSLANWVAKTHHLLATELGLGAGNQALLALPAHWISLPALFGCLTAGLALTDDPADADVAFVEPATLVTAAGVPDLYAVAPESAAIGFGETGPAGATDFVVAVRPQADAWSTVHFGAGVGDVCLDGRSRGEVVEWARQRAAALGVERNARVLSTRSWGTPTDLVDTVLAPLVMGGSLVYVRNCDDPDVLDRRVAQERVTVRLEGTS